MRYPWLAAGVLVTAILACGENKGDTEPVSISTSRVNSIGRTLPPDAAPLDQQVFRVMSPEPRTLDATVNLYDTEGTILPFETLLKRDENWDPVPAGAESYSVSEAGNTWTFLLRPGAKWSDGRPVTAHDHVYTFRRRLDPETANPYAFFFYDIKNAKPLSQGTMTDMTKLGVRALDDLTLVIETEQASPYLPYIVSFGDVYPVPRWQVEKFGRKWTMPENIVSNSGFKLAEWTTGTRMVFVPDPNYNGPHKPYLEKVIHPFRESTTSTILAYENKEVDVETVDITDLSRIQNDPQLKPGLTRVPARASWYLFFRTEQPPFNDVRVREAFTRAINRDVITRVILRDTAVPAYSMIPPGFKDYADSTFKSEQGFNPSRAKQLIREAGYPNGRGFPKQELWLRAPTPSLQLVAEAMQGMLKEHIGISVTIRAADRSVYMNNLYNWRMNLGLIIFVADYVDPRNMLDMIWRSQPMGYGRQDWSNDIFDRIVIEAAAELDPAKRSQLYREAERVLVNDYAGGFVFHPDNIELRRPWVKGNELDRHGKPSPIDFTRIYIGKR